MGIVQYVALVHGVVCTGAPSVHYLLHGAMGNGSFYTVPLCMGRRVVGLLLYTTSLHALVDSGGLSQQCLAAVGSGDPSAHCHSEGGNGRLGSFYPLTAWGRRQWVVGLLGDNASLHGVVGGADPSVHYLVEGGNGQLDSLCPLLHCMGHGAVSGGDSFVHCLSAWGSE